MMEARRYGFSLSANGAAAGNGGPGEFSTAFRGVLRREAVEYGFESLRAMMESLVVRRHGDGAVTTSA